MSKKTQINLCFNMKQRFARQAFSAILQ